jgi:hypothetical protein
MLRQIRPVLSAGDVPALRAACLDAVDAAACLDAAIRGRKIDAGI